MVAKVLSKIFGSRNERLVKRYKKRAIHINSLEGDLQQLDDEALKGKTAEFRERLAEGEDLDALLPEAFAVVREAGRRVLDMRHFDVQLVGGMVLHEGNIAEMRTGEGKTLVATLAAYLNALPAEGVHVVTVNDYLAKRDAAWMGRIYEFLGMTTGVIVAGLDAEERKQAYAADITYGTNNEFGFDYLRDNMAFNRDTQVQRGLHFSIVDEVDSILIDEARTPLIISGPTNDNSDLYVSINKLIPRLVKQEEEDGPGDFSLDEKTKQSYLTEEGHQKVEDLLLENKILGEGESLYDVGNISLMHHLNAALRAHSLFHKDVDYVVKDREVIIVDEFTGRTMAGRRWSEGLHQAVEAKEGVPIQNENQTLASITFQNYFRLYEKLSGMTGTADTEAFEFQQIYSLEVVVIPTHMDMVRADHADLVYLTMEEKFQAIIVDIQDCIGRGQPVLVGTASIDSSEYLSGLLNKAKITHQVLNAKQHEKEAHVIEEAGKPGTVTIATNMAGRGTDIVLGGNLDAELARLGEGADSGKVDELRTDWQQRHKNVVSAGGLHIIGTERHESRRIDNQLRGRSGRQGDPGSSRFYLSMEDNLMRIFASDRVKGLMQKLGMQDGEAIEHPWVTKAIENAQRKVEAHNFDIRKHLLEYDDVASDQRKVIYEQRSELMEVDDISDTVDAILEDVVDGTVSEYIAPGSLDEQWDVDGLATAMEREFDHPMEISKWLDEDDSLHEETLRERIHQEVTERYKSKETTVGAEVMRRFEKDIMLQVLDQHWKEHLASMDYLRQGIGLRGYAQKNPKQEYKRESFDMFQGLLTEIKRDVASILTRVKVQSQEELQQIEEQKQRAQTMQYEHAEAADALHPEEEAVAGAGDDQQQPFRRENRKMGRNEPCWCGSGKKFKQCHGKLV